jgi:hypothetical protein
MTGITAVETITHLIIRESMNKLSLTSSFEELVYQIKILNMF